MTGARHGKIAAPIFSCVPDGAHFLWVKDPNPPDRGKGIWQHRTTINLFRHSTQDHYNSPYSKTYSPKYGKARPMNP